MGNGRDKILGTTAIFAGILFLVTLASRSSQKDAWRHSSTNPISTEHTAPTQQHVSHGDPFLYGRITRAEKNWLQSVKDREIMLQHYGEAVPPFPDGLILPYNVWDFVRPSWFCPHDLERVGKLGDGAKWVCGMSVYEERSPGPSSKHNPAKPLVIYSFGVNDDSSFESAFLQRTNAEIWGYDYSVDGWAKDISLSQVPRAHFKKVGIGKTDKTRDPPFYSIQDLMAENGHDFIDIVKMDIEGAEFEALESLASFLDSKGNTTMPIGQLLIELHFMPDTASTTGPKSLDQFLDWWEMLERLGLRPTNNEDNWIGDAGYCRPRFMEYTMLNAIDTEHNMLLWTD